MADNVELDSGTGGAQIRTIDRNAGGIETPASVLDIGGSSGSESIIGDAGVFMPIEGGDAHDAAITANPILVGAEFDDTTPDSVDEGDVGRMRISSNRNLYTTIRDAAGNERGLNIDASGNLTANLSATDNAVLDAIETNTDYGAVVGGGVEATALRVTLASDSTGVLTVDNSGTFAVQIDGDALTALQKIDNIAHNGSDVALADHVPISGQFDDTATTTVTENQVAPIRITSGRAMHVAQQGTVNVASASALDCSGATVTVSATSLDVRALTNADIVTAELSATDNAVLDAIQTATELIDDAVFADDAAFTLASSKTMVSGAIRDDTLSTLTAIEGDVVPFRVNSTGALHVTGGGGGTEYTEDDAAAANPAGGMMFVVREDARAGGLTSTDGDNVALRGNNSGELYTIDTDANAILTTIDADTSTLAGAVSGSEMQVDIVSGTVTTVSTVTNLAQLGGSAISMNTGAVDAGTQRVTLATDDTVTVDNGGVFVVQVDGAALTSLQKIDKIAHSGSDVALVQHVPISGQFDDTATTTVTENQIAPIRINSDRAMHVSVENTPTVTANAGTDLNTSALALETGGNLATVAGAVSGTEMQVDIVAALPAGTNNIGDVDVATVASGSNLIGDVGIQGRATGGLSIFYDNDLDETAVAVKVSAGTLYSLHVINLTAAPLYMQLFDIAQGSVTVGTTTPTLQFVVPGNADSDGAGFTLSIPQGVAFSTAITAAASTDSEGNGAPAANACSCNLFYK